jgi:DNA-binding SARP family transcriptional activator
MMRVCLLGPMEVVRNDVATPVPGSRRQALLAVLALHCGQVVDTDRLIGLAWGEATAPPARNTLQTHLSYLRRTLDVPIVAKAPGYVLEVAGDGTDVLVAEGLIRRGRHTSDPADRVRHLQAALALWRGRPLAGLADLAWAGEQTRRLDQLGLEARQSLIDARLALGQHVQLVAELQQLTREHPYDEPLHGRLMLALYRCGRQAEALAVYERLRHALADGLGIDPGPELVRTHLLTEHAPGRYTFHDLLRAYAGEQAAGHESDDARHAALLRVLDHYVHTGHAAAHLLNPTRTPVGLAPPQPGVAPEHLDGHDGAMAWFAAEQQVLLTAIDRAGRAGLDAHVWRLAWTLGPFLLRRGHWAEQLTVQHTALAAAGRLGDVATQGDALCGLGTAHVGLGRLDDAEVHFRQERDLLAAAGDRSRQARACLGLARVAEQRGRHAEALGFTHRALELYRAGDDRVGQANALNWIGWVHSQLGEFHQALAHGGRALPLLREYGHLAAVADTLDGLGYAHRGLSDYEQAADCYQRALDVYRDLGDRYGEAYVLGCLGDTHHAAGALDAARTVWRLALDILTDLGHPGADELHAKLKQA